LFQAEPDANIGKARVPETGPEYCLLLIQAWGFLFPAIGSSPQKMQKLLKQKLLASFC
jgi:hypothetical protein